MFLKESEEHAAVGFVRVAVARIAPYIILLVTVVNLCALVDPGRSVGRSVSRFSHHERVPFFCAVYTTVPDTYRTFSRKARPS